MRAARVLRSSAHAIKRLWARTSCSSAHTIKRPVVGADLSSWFRGLVPRGLFRVVRLCAAFSLVLRLLGACKEGIGDAGES